MKTIYTVDYFIKKFESIPDSKWTTGVFMLGGACCAQGHCGINNSNANLVWSNPISELPAPLHEGASLVNLFKKTDDCFSRIGSINNGTDGEYTQPTPKQRVLAALYDLKAKQPQPEAKTEKVVYVTVDSEVRVLQSKELSLN